MESVSGADGLRPADFGKMGLTLGIFSMTPQEAYAFAKPGFKAYAEARFADAEAVANQILALAPDDPNGLYLKGICRRASKDPEAALAYVQRAAEIVPGQMGFDVAIGQILTDMERYDEAIKHLKGLIPHYPQSDLPLLRLGEIYRRIRQTDDARTYLEAALKLRGDNPETHLELSRTFETDRNPEPMAHEADLALQLVPSWFDATLVRARADMMRDFPERVIERLSAQTDPAPDRICELTSLLGEAYDAAGKPEEAFACWARGNATARKHFERIYESGHSAFDLAGAQRAKRVYEKLDTNARVDDPLRDIKSPVFLVGFPRSGTTLIEQILAAHPSIRTSDERDCIGPILQRVAESDASLEDFFSLDPSELELIRDEYWERVQSAGVLMDRPVYVDKSPLNMVWIGVLTHLFPGAHFITAIRDPRAVTFASFKKNFSMNAATFNMLTLADTARFYDAVFSAFKAGQRAFPQTKIHTIKYEDLVDQFDFEVRQLIASLDLPWQEAVLEYREKLSTRTISTPSSDQVAQPIFTNSVSQWRRHRDTLDPVRDRLEPWIRRLGYAQD
jgi:tetratricopeptide (TPR) repeat protein